MPSSSSVRSSTAHWVNAPAAATWLPIMSASAFDGRVAQDRDGGLELPEAERHRGGGVGGDQERVVDAVRHVRLDRRRPPHAHLLHRLQDLDRREERERRGDLRRGHARGQARDLAAGDRRVDDHARELERFERHRLLGDGQVDAVARDELVEEVELGLRLAVELDDPPILDPERGLGIERAREGDEAERRVLGYEVVAADRPRGVERGTGGRLVFDAHCPRKAR